MGRKRNNARKPVEEPISESETSEQEVRDSESEEEHEEASSGAESGEEQEEILDTSDEDAEQDEGESSDAESSDGNDEQTAPSRGGWADSEPRGQEPSAVDSDDEGVSSDEEHQRNTTGNVPLQWYDEFDHIGYDKAGKKIIRSEGMDEVDKAIAARDDPHYRRSIYDARNDENITLTDRELVMVTRMLAGKFPQPEFNAHEEYVDWFTRDRMVTPISHTPEPKRRFIPSKWERMKVMKIVRGIKEGYIKPDESKTNRKPPVFLLWGENDEVEDAVKRKGPRHIPAPKTTPPGHSESYHPPPEYLMDKDELEAWLEMDPQDRPTNFIPKDHGILRRVPAYKDFVKERFERCLDLYLCARAEKHRLNIDPESLVPRLPLPSELRPFPTTTAVTYMGHYGRVRSLAVDPTGQWLATGGDDMTVKIWEVESGRCIRSWNLANDKVSLKPTKRSDQIESVDAAAEDEDREAINKLAWNPSPSKHVLACAVGRKVVLLYTGTICGATEVSGLESEATKRMLVGMNPAAAEAANDDGDKSDDDDAKPKKKVKGVQVKWEDNFDQHASASLLGEMNASTIIRFANSDFQDVLDIAWHNRGEYLATVSSAVARGSGQVMVHHVVHRKSQSPFSNKVKGDIQKVLFHPNKPIFFVATKTHVSVYHLVKQMLVKKLSSGAKWISSIAIHPAGDNLVVGSYDRRVCWFDLDLANKPYKTLKYHTRAVRQVAFHGRYPLLASAADDGSIHIFHARVFDDLLRNPLIVPVKVINSHGVMDGLGVMDCVFHPTQPWLFSAGADGAVHLYQNMP